VNIIKIKCIIFKLYVLIS